MTNVCALVKQVFSCPEWLVVVLILCGLWLFWFVFLRLVSTHYWAVWQKFLYGLISVLVAFWIYVCFPWKGSLVLHVLVVVLAMMFLHLVYWLIARIPLWAQGVWRNFKRIKVSVGKFAVGGWVPDIVTILGCLYLIWLIWFKAHDCIQRTKTLETEQTLEKAEPVTLKSDSGLGRQWDGDAGEKEVAGRLLWPIIGSVTGLAAFLAIRRTLREVIEMQKVEIHSSIKGFQDELLDFLKRCLEKQQNQSGRRGPDGNAQANREDPQDQPAVRTPSRGPDGNAQANREREPVFLAVAHIFPPGWATDQRAAHEVMALLREFARLRVEERPEILVPSVKVMKGMIKDIAGEDLSGGFESLWQEFQQKETEDSIFLFVPPEQLQQPGRMHRYTMLPHLHIYVSKVLCEALIAVPIGSLPWLGWARDWVAAVDKGPKTNAQPNNNPNSGSGSAEQASIKPAYIVLVVRTRQRSEVSELWDQVQRMIENNKKV